jgi:HKD family nuclease
MNVSPLVQQKSAKRAKTIQGVLEAYIRAESYDHVYAAMAYVTIAGIRALLSTFSKRKIKQSQWLVGLDDAVTQPGAIKLLLALDGAEVRIASLNSSSLRFHPKVCRFVSSQGQRKELMMIGSANLTSSALVGNSEAVVFLDGQSPTDKRLFAQTWIDLWSQGHVPKAKELANYETKYEALKKFKKQFDKKSKVGRPRIPKKIERILEGDVAELDPSHANKCWIECGFITAMGRELEFKAEQGLFFGLEPTGGTERVFRFRVSNGSIVNLRMKYQENHMWRLQMNNSVPEVERGLRPRNPDGKLGRSKEVAVFTRTNTTDLFSLRFLKLSSQQFEKLQKKSRLLGTVGHTTTRSYGWC